MPSLKPVNDGGFIQKIFTLTEYDMSLLKNVHSKKNKALIESGAAKLVVSYFEHLIDAKARVNPSSLHHVYEFDMAGTKEARLFSSRVDQTPAGALITFRFKDTKYPNRNGYMFYKKAQIMEAGSTVIVKPRNSKYLKYKLKNGRFVVTQNPSIITNPGGDVAGNFEAELKDFNGTQAGVVLREFKYYDKVNDNIKRKRTMIVPRINRQTLANAIQQGKVDASRIALEANNSVN